MNKKERFLEACACRTVDRTPVWLMRQAGRVLPEYRALKEKHSFLELVQTPDLAVEVTLQPVRRFDFDAAILFSDILVIAEALGQAYHFRDHGGIAMEFAVRSESDIEKLDETAVRARLQYVEQAVRILRRELGEQTALIGFSGAPWTLANFMIEGGSAREFSQAKLLALREPAVYARLAGKLTRAVTAYLQMQIEAGADAVQIFDTLGGLLSPDLFEWASARWIREIVSGLGGRVPVIVFAKGANGCWDILAQTGATVLGVDWTVRLAEVRSRLPASVALQGNLDPSVLTATPAVVKAETWRILEQMRGSRGHIFNLGHGVPPTAALENVAALVESVRGFA